jgi:signal transduction histidine kinase
MTTPAPVPPPSRAYRRFQLIFWGGYWLLNIAYAQNWGYRSWLTLALFGFLSCMLAGTTHGYRHLYLRYGLDKTLGGIGLHLMWLLPLSALSIVVAMSLASYASLRLLPVAGPSAVGPWSWPIFVTYIVNSIFILGIWSLICLWRAESQRRGSAERDHWRNEIRLREVELQFLRSQINSHFLFNALNNIRALILEDPQAARQALTDLATMLRGVMHSEAVTTVSLRDELALVKGYLALEALQFEHRLSFDFAIDPLLQDAKLPPLLLQTLVENAIKHGIARRAGGGAVHISAAPTADRRWRLQVENPPAELPATREGQGIGLKNARARLKAIFGDLASLELRTAATVLAVAELPR